jgi:integrase
VISQGLVAEISGASLWRWLSSDALRPWQHRSWIFPRDPNFAAKAGPILDLYHRMWEGAPLGDNDFVISADEKTSVPARHVTRAGQYGRILAIRNKKALRRVATYLEPEQARAVIAAIDRRSPNGERDHALLLFLYNTGARVSEALAIRARDLQLDRPRQVRLLGKGRKERICPLWPETASALHRIIPAKSAEDFLFRNTRGAPLTRDGVAYLLRKYVRSAAQHTPALRKRRVTPHVMRHSCAVALLQAGIDVSVIRDYLGHASVATTSRYITTNLQMKRDVLEAFWKRAGLDPAAPRKWRPSPKLLAFLESL